MNLRYMNIYKQGLVTNLLKVSIVLNVIKFKKKCFIFGLSLQIGPNL